MLAKYVLLILIILFVLQVVRTVRFLQNRGRVNRPHKENMVVCDHCRVNFPESESVVSNGRVFCSEEHQRASRER
ncbi:MAG: hypothetical protein CMK56_01140 [Proteobacteria bacterium]|nr:hypothetical protein [Pseudomonadota bacterium]